METAGEPPWVPLEISEEFEARRLTEERIVTALMDDCSKTIGIFGVGGVDKTIIASLIEKVKREKLFEAAIMVRVGPEPDPERMAHEIFGNLGVRFEEGDVVAQTTVFLSKMVMQDRVLIMLDDVWTFLDLGITGIPKGSCKIMIVSRFMEVCLEMGCSVIFKLIADDVLTLKDDSSNGSASKSSARSLGRKQMKFPRRSLSVTELVASRISLSEQRVLGATAKRLIAKVKPFDENEKNVMAENHGIPSILHTLQGPYVRSGGFQVIPGKMEMLMNPITLLVLDLRGSDLQELPGELKNLTNLRLLNLSNCRNLQTIEYGLISSFVHLEELYMLGSFSDWEVEKEGKAGGNASINELEVLDNLTTLQIQIRDPGFIPESSSMWSRLTSYVISTPEELKCKYKESSNVSFPAVDGSESAVDELIPDCFKHLKQLHIGGCNTMEYLVDGVPTDGLFLFLESLRLDGLHLFKKMFNGHGSCFLSLKSIHISHCPKLQSLFSLSMAWTLVQLEAITIESCEMMQEVIVDEGEAGRLQTNGSLFPRLRKLKLLGLSMLKSFCHAMNDLELPSLENLTLNGCNKMEEFSGGKLSMPVLRYVEIDFYIRETNGVNSIQHLFNDKVIFFYFLIFC